MSKVAINNGSVRKSLACVESDFSRFMFVSVEPFMKLKERKAHRFTISYSQTRNAAASDFFTSSDFAVGGADWYIGYFPQGCLGSKTSMTIGLYLYKRNPPDKVVAMLAFHLLDKSGRSVTSNYKLMCSFGTRWGWLNFMERAELEEKCIQDDNLVIDCELAVYEVIVPPTDIQADLQALWESKEMTDVTFLVDGEIFSAHRCWLAARSLVLKALLFGPMSESRLDCIPIADVKASTFKAMLHYIYTDTLPENVKLCAGQDGNCIDEVIIANQHLLEAADRYGLGRLKLLCEGNLCKALNVETVAGILALAYQHGCDRLKEACLEYMMDPEIYFNVTLTSGFIHLVQSCPEVKVDLHDLHQQRKFGEPFLVP